MRITGGLARGIILKTPDGNGTRPATDRMRESVFSSLAHRVEGANVLDLFAGTGSYGLECLSRGASQATFIDMGKKVVKLIEINAKNVLKSAGLQSHQVTILCEDTLAWSPMGPAAYDLVFIDPPYPLWPQAEVMLLPRIMNWLAPEANLIIEFPGGLDIKFLESLEIVKIFGKGKHEPQAAWARKKS